MVGPPQALRLRKDAIGVYLIEVLLPEALAGASGNFSGIVFAMECVRPDPPATGHLLGVELHNHGDAAP
jgi:hypothetical protein